MATPQKHKKWSAIHYNAIAKEIRESLSNCLEFHNNWSELKGYDNKGKYYATEALVVLALNLCKRFKEDSDAATEGYQFDPIKFLTACSPDPDLYPLQELWEEK